MFKSLKICMMKMAERVFHASCKDTYPFLSEMLDHPLPLFSRLRLRIHLAMCEVCRYYKDQLAALQILAKELGREDVPGIKTAELPEKTRAKIKQMIEARN